MTAITAVLFCSFSRNTFRQSIIHALPLSRKEFLNGFDDVVLSLPGQFGIKGRASAVLLASSATYGRLPFGIAQVPVHLLQVQGQGGSNGRWQYPWPQGRHRSHPGSTAQIVEVVDMDAG